MISELLETPRLKLRPFRDGDAEPVFSYWASDPNWSRFNESVPADPTIHDAEEFVRKLMSRAREDQPHWAIVLAREVVGVVSLTFEQGHRIAVIGYGIHGELRGNGYSVEAATAVINGGFDAYPQLCRIRAHTDARNATSLRVLEKLGFLLEGVLRSNQFAKGELADEAVCGLLRDDWVGAR